jgi:hypothetical protein
MGRSGIEVKRIAAFIPRGPIDQSVWKDDVCIRYGHGESLQVAMKSATATIRSTNPGFEPVFDPAIETA